MDPGRRRGSFASKRSAVTRPVRTAIRVVGGGGTADGRSLGRRVAIHHCGAEWRSDSQRQVQAGSAEDEAAEKMLYFR